MTTLLLATLIAAPLQLQLTEEPAPSSPSQELLYHYEVLRLGGRITMGAGAGLAGFGLSLASFAFIVGVSSTNGDGVGAPGWVTPAFDFALVAVPVGVALGLIGLGVSFYADSQIDALYKPPR